jgi:hypothetical protein
VCGSGRLAVKMSGIRPFGGCLSEASLEGGEQRRNVINELGPGQRIALGELRIASNGLLP